MKARSKKPVSTQAIFQRGNLTGPREPTVIPPPRTLEIGVSRDRLRLKHTTPASYTGIILEVKHDFATEHLRNTQGPLVNALLLTSSPYLPLREAIGSG